jgi:hypothetical protein
MGLFSEATKAAKETGSILLSMAQNGIDTTEVQKDILDLRNSICSKCESLTTMLMMRKCRECGCFLGVKNRLIYDPVETARHGGEKQMTKCPLGKW